MNQHDEQHGGQPDEASPAGTGPATGEAQGDEAPATESAVPTEPQAAATGPAGAGSATGEASLDTTGPAAAEPVTGDAPVHVSEQGPAAAGNGASGAPGPSASTGDDRVDEALSRLAELDRLDVTEHAGVVEDVHRALQDTLAEEED